MHLRQGERAEDNDKDLQVDFPEAFCGYVRQGEGRIGRLVPVDPEELLRRQREEESAPSGRLVPVDVPRVREVPTTEPATERTEQTVIDRLIAFSLVCSPI